MRIIKDTTEFYIEEETAVAIGKFDGFHRGHQKLLENVRAKKQMGLAAAVFTFMPSPAVFFAGQNVKELTTREEKRKLFEAAGVDYLIEYPFYQEIADMDPEEYIREVLVKRLHAKCIVAGEDVSYGRHGAGNSKLLAQKASVYGYEVLMIDKVLYEGKEVSSTFVREEVKCGNMELAGKLLGTPYHINGTIIHGRKLGRTIGMPTVNLAPPAEKLLPPKGVYYSYVVLNGRKYYGITNIGTKPTVDQKEVMGVETYIYQFDEDVYGEELDLYVLAFKRPEMKFRGVTELKAQMEKDIAAGRRYHGIG